MEVRNSKVIISGKVVREKIRTAAAMLNDVVGATLGPKGRNVSFELNWYQPKTLHDGVSIARQIVLKDPFENMAASSIIAAAIDTNNAAGDGTTTATILTYAITNEALTQIASNANPEVLRRGLTRGVEVVKAELEKIKTPIKTLEQMTQVATVSSASPVLGKMIAETIEKLGGAKGVVSVQRGSGMQTEVLYKEGMELDAGFISPVMITDASHQESILDTVQENMPFVVVIDDTFTNQIMIDTIGKIITQNRQHQILIIAQDFDQESEASLVTNCLRNGFKIVAIRCPEYGPHRSDLMRDIAILTGGKVIGGHNGIAPKDSKFEDFGRADRVVITREVTAVIRSNKQEVAEHVAGLEHLLTQVKEEGARDKLQARIARLKGGAAVISVSAASLQETDEIYERVYDAVNATKAAISDGIVPGGGVCLLRASKALTNKKLVEELGESAPALEILRRALAYPIKRLVENAGSKYEPGFVLGEVLRHDNVNYGYNVATDEFGDLLEEGVIDPLKVTRSALENAASVSNMLITTEHMIAFDRDTLPPGTMQNL